MIATPPTPAVAPVQKCGQRDGWWILVVIGALTVVFAAGIMTGFALDIGQKLFTNDGAVNIERVVDLYGKTRSPNVPFDQFWQVWDEVKKKYVDQPVNEVDLFYGAMQGIVRGLDDPHSVFFPPQEAATFAKDLTGEFEGVGAEIGIQNDQLTVIAPLPGSPAEKAGVVAGLKILAINGKETKGMSLEEAVNTIRGPVDTTVTLTVSEDGFDAVRDITITRQKIVVPTIIVEPEKNGLVFLRITFFNQDTWPSFDKAVRELLRNPPKGIILDLRGNPGGFLETAIDVASEWVRQGVIVRERGTDGHEKAHESRGGHRLADISTVVLVDKGSASGAEIVAGALQDYKVATLVGEKTYGKGSVQDFELFPDGSALKLTIAKWYTPLNRGIDKAGITPDIILDHIYQESANTDEQGKPIMRDLAREKARTLLR